MKPNASPKQDLKKNKNSSTTLLKQIQVQLKNQSDSPYLDSLVLLGHISGKSKSELLAHPSHQLSAKQNQSLTTAINQLKDGIPLPYVLGEWEFFNLRFTITPDVLIPRPETEGLVDLALRWLQNNSGKRSCLEIGTGSGCIAVSLAKSFPDLKIIATDISGLALQVAKDNAGKHGVLEQIQFLERDLFTGIDQPYDLLVANLPYIPSDKLRSLAVYQTEPSLALDGGQDGLHYIKGVLKKAGQHLNPGGAIFLELDEDCGGAALALAKEIWPGITLHLDQDLSGQDRYLSLQLNE
jgi:release factor glutamine methyltransferase